MRVKGCGTCEASAKLVLDELRIGHPKVDEAICAAISSCVWQESQRLSRFGRSILVSFNVEHG
jgi:hypothetical protein